jgi:hypothetical protein
MISEAVGKMIRLPLFSRPRQPERAWEVISWWESRRVPYNHIVGATGVASGVVILITRYATERVVGEAIGIPDSPFFALMAAFLYERHVIDSRDNRSGRISANCGALESPF